MAAASAVALTGVFAAANAQVVPLEIEGPVSSVTASTPESGFVTVMGQQVYYDENTAFVTPTSDKTKTRRTNAKGVLTNNPLTATQWLRGENFAGRRRPGFLGGTLIVTGFWDPALNGTGGIYAEEIFSDISENVILGVITDNVCTNNYCNNPNDYIEGNASTKFVDNKDQRLPAHPIVDAGLFELDLTGANLVGGTFGGEGYYSDDAVFPRLGALILDDPETEEVESGREPPTENALVYWDFALGDFRPDLLADKTREISVLRIRCDVGDRLEVRGWVHQNVDLNGNSTSGSAATGIIRAIMRFPGANDIIVTNGVPVAEANNAYGRYRLRGDVNNCADEVEVQWLSAANNGTILASTVASVDRLREDGDDD